MADETIQTPTVSVTIPPQGNDIEDMGTYTAKFVAAFLAGPVGSKLLNKIGVPLDPASTTVFIAMALHKLHDVLKKQYPNSNWL
jgi:hypothetical protein